MTAMWPPFWCQAQRRRPEAGCPGREDLERWLFISSHASAARHPLGAASTHPGTWATRALAALGSGRGIPACAGWGGGGWQSTLPLQVTRWSSETKPGLLSNVCGGRAGWGRQGSGRKELRMLANVYKALTFNALFFFFIFGCAGSSLLCMGLSVVAVNRAVLCCGAQRHYSS